VWSVVFLIVNVVVSLVVIGATIAVLGFASGDARGYLNSLFPQANRPAAAANANAGPAAGDQEQAPAPAKTPKYSAEFGRALMPAMLATQVALVLFGWLVLRVSAGPEWARIVGLRRPSFTQGFVALLGLPGLMLVATAVHALSKKVLPG